MLWAFAVGYAGAGAAVIWLAVLLAPWGLLLLLAALAAFAVAALIGFIAVGIARVEEDES